MSTTAQSIIDSAAILLHDSGSVRWPVPEMLGWLNAGQRDSVVIKPDCNSKTVAFTLTQGSRQHMGTLADLHLLLKINRNLAADGITPSRIIRITSAELLDSFDANWHTTTPATPVVHYTYDPTTPSVFQTWPPAVAGSKIEVVYSAMPATLTAGTDLIELKDSLSNALVDYLCCRALTKDAEFGDNAEKAAAHYRLFLDALGHTTKQLLEQNPNLTPGPFNPTNIAGAK